ncbi:MAG: DUF72 domain-containing protein [Candidatus Acidiferrales bacterium]
MRKGNERLADTGAYERIHLFSDKKFTSWWIFGYTRKPMGEVNAGTSGWAYASWKPRFYPATLGSSQFLNYYATRLNSVEVNYTFRSIPTEEQLRSWIAATPPHFRFAVKAHQEITHFKRLRGAARTTSEFFSSLRPFQRARRLGPVLFQLPPNFKCNAALLKDFLVELPKDQRIAFEFRHPSWFCDEVYASLQNSNVALCHAESEMLETPQIQTAGFFYLRLRKDHYSKKSRQLLAKTIIGHARKGDVFVYFKHEDTPKGALYADELLAATHAI